MFERHYSVTVTGTTITFECKNGHRYKKDFGKGPVPERMPAWWCRRMLSYWSHENQGVRSPPCKKCRGVGIL